ncbi:retinal homeobox protein Rx2-like [Actinia tenebrosa]|uniref:Retinal homeobox protein Rx2-like n=1 Tax=Actinia tenebrosa TaxID=6105 RepID=A0A6P8I756_ACTTE|nr:retinal homeobox protein Rx2-like [Actinia tenebrosa]
MEDYVNFSAMEQYWSLSTPFDPRCTCSYNTPHGVSQDPIYYDDLKDKQSISLVSHVGSSLGLEVDENENTTDTSEHCVPSALATQDKVEVSSAVFSNSEAQSTKVHPNLSLKGDAKNQPSVSRKAVVKQRKTRTLFTPGQINILEQVFSQYHYIASSHRKLLAQKIGISEAQVRVWFQNRRIKWRKEGKEFIVKSENK